MELDRRALTLSTLALTACSSTGPRHTSRAAVTGNNVFGEGRMLSINGKDLYVEIAGPASAPPLIYLHGGPGTGSYDFSVTQGALLAQRLRVIMLDQRGVLRSEPLADADTCSLSDLVEDLEALRDALRLRTWSFVGHSFGGYLGLRYALTHPRRVKCAIFENATIDIDSSARHLLRRASEIYAELGDHANAQACLDAAAAPTAARETWERFGDLVNDMPRRDQLYFYGGQNVFARMVEASGLSPEFWAHGAVHQRKLFEDGALFTSLKPRLSELETPSLMIHSAFDYVSAPDQIEAFAAGPRRALSQFPNSAHFAHIEEPDRFARTVTEFVLA